MKKSIILFLIFILLFTLNVFPTFAKDNDWVVDEPNVLTEDTLNYIGNLNENVYPTYKNKPQLGVVIINELPNNTTMDEYKLDLFNDYGVGTKEENCGMLFVFSISDREYGFEIGDGFKEGSLVRYYLDKDFVDDDIKNLLRNENYDAATMKIAEHLDIIMQSEENGTYAAKEIEIKKQMEIQEREEKESLERLLVDMKKIAIALVILSILLFITYFVWSFYKKRIFFEDSNKKILSNKNKLLAINMYSSALNEKFIIDCWEYNKNQKEKIDIITFIYNHYVENFKNEIKTNSNLKFDSEDYIEIFSNINTFTNFIGMELLSMEDIIERTNFICQKKLDTIKANKKLIFDYIDNFDLKNSKISKENLKLAFDSFSDEFLYTSETIVEKVTKKLESLEYDYYYDDFVEKNKDNINSRYFDKSDFYKELKKSSDYSTYKNNIFSNPAILFLLLNSHMDRNEHSYHEQQRRNSESNNDSFSDFGGGFGGGFSSGGGFSGGW